MKKIRLLTIPADIPERLMPLLFGASVWDSSCSPEARVLYIEKMADFISNLPQRERSLAKRK